MLYFDNLIKIEDFGFDKILMDKKSYEIILIYQVSFKTFLGAKPYNKVNGFTRDYDGTKYLVLFLPEKYVMFDRIRCFIRL